VAVGSVTGTYALYDLGSWIFGLLNTFWAFFSMGDYEWFISFPWDEFSRVYGAYQFCMLGYKIWLLD
jgi:hypothetical protein